MQKSTWNEIWLTYRLNATRLNLFKEIFQRTDLAYKVITGVSILFFLGAIIWFFVSGGSDNPSLSVKPSLAVIASEISTLYLMDQMKSRSFGQNFLFAGETHHRSPRFEMFKENLQKKQIGFLEIKNNMNLLDSEIELAASGSGNARRVASFGIPLLVGLMVGIATSINNIGIVLMAFWISLGFFIIAYLLASTFRTQEESLRELKTFINLYIAESNENSGNPLDNQESLNACQAEDSET